MKKYIDTNVFLRRLEGDQKSIDFLNSVEVGSDEFLVPAIVISEIVWVLGSFYNRGRAEVVDYLKVLVGTRNLKVVYEYDVRKSLELFEKYDVKYNDCVIVSATERGDQIVSFDREFDRFEGIKRIEP